MIGRLDSYACPEGPGVASLTCRAFLQLASTHLDPDMSASFGDLLATLNAQLTPQVGTPARSLLGTPRSGSVGPARQHPERPGDAALFLSSSEDADAFEDEMEMDGTTPVEASRFSKLMGT